jgi:hypothetical protein
VIFLRAMTMVFKPKFIYGRQNAPTGAGAAAHLEGRT